MSKTTRLTTAQIKDVAEAVRAGMTLAEARELVLGVTAESPVAAATVNHWKAKDLACDAPAPCERTFRTAKGRDWHVANIAH